MGRLPYSSISSGRPILAASSAALGRVATASSRECGVEYKLRFPSCSSFNQNSCMMKVYQMNPSLAVDLIFKQSLCSDIISEPS